MGLLPIGGGGNALLKSNSKSGTFEVEGLAYNELKFMCDLENLEVGLIKYSEMGPDFRMVRAVDLVNNKVIFPAMPADDDKWKRGFRAVVKLPDTVVNGTPSVREWSANSMLMGQAMNSLFESFWSARDAHSGKVPVVHCSGFEKVSGKAGTNYKPVLNIIDWRDRPADLDGQVKAGPSTAPVQVDDDDIPLF